MLLYPPSLQTPGLELQNPRGGGGGGGGNPHFPINAATSSSSSSNKKADDYHSTFRAFNSDGRSRNPRKCLGQHYMLNSSINEQLAAVAEVRGGDLFLEIGPGTGSLTNVLINAGATVIVVEKLVANIPFNISTDVVKLLLPMGDLFSEVVLLLQEETALRLVDASLRTSEYRPVNIFVNLYSDPEYKFKVERTNFFPQPNVDAAVVRFKLKQSSNFPPVTSTKSFFLMVSSAFNGKRKMLRNSHQHLCSSHDIESALKDMNLPITARPEELTMDDFVMLHKSISKLST